MKLWAAAFTARGLRLAERLPGLLGSGGIDVRVTAAFGGSGVTASRWAP